MERMKKWYGIDVKVGDPKAPHWHVYLDCPHTLPVSTVAKWFNVPAVLVDVKNGRGVFLDCVKYLTHCDQKQQDLGKFRYPNEIVRANFEWLKALDEREELRSRNNGKDMTEKERYKDAVLYRGMTLKELEKERADLLRDHLKEFSQLRMEYLKNHSIMPPVRLNFYISGGGSMGKNLMSRALAVALCPCLSGGECDSVDTYFDVGEKACTFDGYDGQPVIIWNDWRAGDFIDRFGGRGAVFDLLDPFPDSREGGGRRNIKYGSIRLVNAVNIINGVTSYSEFLDGLAGEYHDKHGILHESEDKNQSYRRFPFIINLNEDDFDLLLNRGWMEDTREYQQYHEIKHIRGSLHKMASVLGTGSERYKQVEAKMTKPVMEHFNEVYDRVVNKPELSDDELNEMIAGYGEQDDLRVIYDELKESYPDMNVRLDEKERALIMSPNEQSLKEVAEINNDEVIPYYMESVAGLEVDGEKVYSSSQLAEIKLELSGYHPAFPSYYQLPDDVSAPSPEWCEGVREMRRKEAERLRAQERKQEKEKRTQSQEADAELDKLKKKVLSGEHFEQIKQEQQRQADIEQIFAMPSSLHV